MGVDVSDAWPFVGICSTTEEPYGFSTELAGDWVVSPCTKTEWRSCADKAGNETQFNAKMSSVHGAAWDDVPDTGSDPAKDVLRAAYNGVRLAYA